jgi:hypothetical protein
MDEGGQASSTEDEEEFTEDEEEFPEDEEELFDSGSWMGSTAPKIDASLFKKQESEER